MTVVDVIIIFVILLSALFSLMRGFVKESISLTTWILAIWIATTFAARLAAVLPGIESEAVRLSVGFGLLFVVTLMLGALVNVLVAHFVKKTGLTGADRVFGVVFGFLRGILIIVVFVVVSSFTPLPEQEWWKSSNLLGRFEVLGSMLKPYFPESSLSPGGIVK
ncbi:MAG: CvpA family protein [Gammaproteobacteria bacterium]|nr:CvpA family protein [Gammaproteobacteria bacterium]MCW8922911.1 CvpA family protein [Gammaproteobacteria bacterium]